MKQNTDWIEVRQSLRADAEIMVAGVSPAGMAAQPAEIMLHELLLHKVELEMQIEELKSAQTATEEARDRYLQILDFGPVGYVTINRACLIGEINLAGAAMLGVDRTQLVNCRFSKYVSPLDTDRWHRLFMYMMEPAKAEKQAFVLEMTRPNASTFYAHVDCQREESNEAHPLLRLALIDINRIKRAEAEMQNLRIATTAVVAQ